MDPLIKSQLLYQLSYGRTGGETRRNMPEPTGKSSRVIHFFEAFLGLRRTVQSPSTLQK